MAPQIRLGWFSRLLLNGIFHELVNMHIQLKKKKNEILS